MKCPKCQTENPETSRFCADCGTHLGRYEQKSPKDVRPVATETLESPIRELTTGSTFAGRYQIIEELGKGGMGRVYRVLDKKLNEEVALKLIRPEVASEKETIERFNNELKLARKIAHRNVGKMYELMEAEGTHFITMEYVPGQDLRGLIRQMGRLTTGKAVSIARQVCDGLEEAHRLGVVHRDLKPGNILIDKDGNARIMDFGIARSIHGQGITGAGVLIGTPEYMSPEQVEGKEADRQSDVYSLGVILYEMVTGQRPFEGETPLSVAHKQKYEPPMEPRKVNAQIPAELNRVIMRCLEKEKERRYQSAEELRSDLVRLEGEIPTAERVVPKRKPTKPKEVRLEKRQTRWTRVALYGGAIALIALILYAGIHLISGRKEIIDSIAVLPFENVNADPNTDYLCDGITETIINKLSQLSVFKTVINRTSVFTYKGKTVDPKRVGQELGVKAVLLTRMVQLGDRLTISPTLVRTKDNSQLWGERYDQKFEEVFSIEENIAASIVQALRLKLTTQDQQKISERPIDNAAAYQLYLRSTYEIWRYKEDALDRIVQDLQDALDITGPNPLLFAAMAQAYFQYVNIGAKQEDFLAKAEDFANKAIAIDPDLSKAYVVLAFIHELDNQQEGIRLFKKAFALDPNEPRALGRLAMIYLDVGQPSRALPFIERYEKAEPLDTFNYFLRGILSYYDGQFGLALDLVRKWYQSDPESPVRAFQYALMLAYTNASDDALSTIDDYVRVEPGNIMSKFGLLFKYALQKDREKALQIVTPDFIKTCRRDSEWSQIIADGFALLGEKDEALDWLENAVNRGFINYPFMSKHDIFLDNIRGEERFKKLMARAKYKWEHFEE